MDILVTRVYDTLRFKHYFHIKLMLPSKSALIDNMINNINSGKNILIRNLPECDVRYLQRPNLQYTEYFCAINKPICDLKILNNMSREKHMRNRPSIPPYLDNERQSSKETDITPSCDNKPQSSSFELYSVTYTKVIENKEALNMHQITALLNDPNVKSINIKK